MAVTEKLSACATIWQLAIAMSCYPLLFPYPMSNHARYKDTNGCQGKLAFDYSNYLKFL